MNTKDVREWKKRFPEVFLKKRKDLTPKTNVYTSEIVYEECTKELEDFISELLREARGEAGREHSTFGGYCCACGYDQAVFEGKLWEQKDLYEKEMEEITVYKSENKADIAEARKKLKDTLIREVEKRKRQPRQVPAPCPDGHGTQSNISCLVNHFKYEITREDEAFNTALSDVLTIIKEV